MITLNLFYTILLFLLYGIMDIAIPAVALYPLIKNKNLAFRILFYQISSMAYVSLSSYALSYLKIYSTFTSWLVFFIFPILFRAFISRRQLRQRFVELRSRRATGQIIHEGTRLRNLRIRRRIKGILKICVKQYIWPNLVSILSFLLIVYLIGKDLGYFHLHSYTYACSDEPTHIYWVSSLIHGDPFPAGLYPHGMHFLVGKLCSMFGLNVARAWLSFGIVSLSIILMSAFLCASSIFSNQVTGLIGVMLFICAGVFPVGIWFERLLMVLPMEFAMYAFFVTIYGLISWVRDQSIASLLMIGLGILGTTLIHFFVTIFTFFMVVAFIVVFHGVMVRNKSLHKLFLCGALSIILAVLPYLVGMVFGYQLEQSFRWGMDNVSVGSSGSTGGQSYTLSVGEEPISDPTEYSIKELIKQADSVSDYVDVVGSIMVMYFTKTEMMGYILLACCLSLLLYGGACFILRKKEEKKMEALVLIFISFAWLTEFLVLYVGYVLGLFSLVIPTRSSEFIGMMSILVIGAPFSLLFDAIAFLRINTKVADVIITGASVAAIAFLSTKGYGMSYHDLAYGFTMENIDIKTEEYLVNNAPKETWTYIGTTNARMAAKYYGYHYEITDLLLANRDAKSLYLPTKDIYISVEKNVPYMGNKNVDGSDYQENTVPVSAYFADVLLTDVIRVVDGAVNSEVYLNTYSRVVIMSHLYYWMEKIKEVYPNEITVFEEDENCVIYHIQQDEYFLLNLVTDYSELIERDLLME